MPSNNRDARGNSSSFHPTWGTLNGHSAFNRSHCPLINDNPSDVGSLATAFEEPLEAEADAEQRPAALDYADDGVAPFAVERRGLLKVSDARDDDTLDVVEIGRHARCQHLGADRRERFAHRRQIAGAVIDQRNHSSPFVLGSVRASCLSREHATRSARPNALNTAST